MLKIRLINLICTTIICCQPIFGQQVYKLKHYGKPGDIYLYNRIPPAQNGNVLTTGTNVTWDLRASSALNTNVSRIITPSEGIDQITFLGVCALAGNSIFDCLNVWSNTEQAVLIPDTLSLFTFSLTNLQRYQNKTSNQLLENFFGFTADFGGTAQQAAIVYASPDTILKFPVTYGNTWMSRIKWGLDLSATGQNVQYQSKQSRTTKVDSWGTIITPFDTFTNVIRVRSEILREDTLVSDSITIPITLTQVEYMWFDTAYKLPVMTANGIATDTADVITAVQYIYEATCPAPSWTVSADQQIYYIDNTGSVTVNFVITNPNANIYNWDFGDTATGTSTGSISHTYYVGGDYSVAVTGCMTDCLPLNSCVSDIIDFVIVDTVTSVLVIPGKELGIKLYPNPAQETIALDVPEDLGTQHYQVLDISGREINSGILHTGSNKIDVDDLANGVYSIQLWNNGGKRSRVAVMQMVIIK